MSAYYVAFVLGSQNCENFDERKMVVNKAKD